MGVFGKLFGKRKEKTEIVEEKAEGKIELSFNLGELENLGLALLSVPKSEELRERVRNAEKMLKQKILEIVGIEVGSKEWGDMIRLQTLVSTDPETSTLIHNAIEKYRLVCGIRVSMDFSKDVLKSIIAVKWGTYGTGMDALRRKLLEAYEK